MNINAIQHFERIIASDFYRPISFIYTEGEMNVTLSFI